MRDEGALYYVHHSSLPNIPPAHVYPCEYCTEWYSVNAIDSSQVIVEVCYR